MNSSKTIQVIHAVDADQHLGHLKKILEELKSEKRIDSYTTLVSDAINRDSFSPLGEEDMVIILLTNGIEPEKTSIESILLGIKAAKPKVLLAEIIIDHVPYETQFIAFPQDLQPIRSREDMDAVWNGIGRNLRDIFPARQEPVAVAKAPFPWKKYLPYALGALALILIFFLGPWVIGDDTGNDDAPGDLKIVNLKASLASPANFKGDCPHPFDFQGIIETNGPGTVVYTWLKSDGTQGPIDTLKFESAESLKVTTNWEFGGTGVKKYEEWQQLKILSPVAMVSNRALFNVECTSNNPTPPVVEDNNTPVEPVEPIRRGSVEITSVSPKSPRRMKVGDRVNFEFKYTMNESDGVFIWGRPMTNGQTTPNYSAHGAQVVKARQGTGSGFFTITSSGKTVDQIRLQMWDADKMDLLKESFYPVRYKFYQSVVVTPTPAPAMSNGSFVVNQTWSGDFDLGRQVPRNAPASEKDFWFNARTATNRAIVPQNGTRLSIMKNVSNPSRVTVIAAIKNGAEKEIDVNKLVPGLWVAVRTSKGKYAAFTTVRKVGPSPGELRVQFRKW